MKDYNKPEEVTSEETNIEEQYQNAGIAEDNIEEPQQ